MYVERATQWFVVGTLCGFEAARPLLAVAAEGVFDDGQRGRGRLNLIDLHHFSLELLVVLEEATQHQQAMARHVARLLVGIKLWIAGSHGDDFVVELTLVDHGHQPDRAGVDDGQRHDRCLAQHQHVEGGSSSSASVCGMNP